MDQFVDAKIQSSQYANASEVLRAGLRALEKVEKEQGSRPRAIREPAQTGLLLPTALTVG
jgi:antitoxin ParD1/3/4